MSEKIDFDDMAEVVESQSVHQPSWPWWLRVRDGLIGDLTPHAAHAHTTPEGRLGLGRDLPVIANSASSSQDRRNGLALDLGLMHGPAEDTADEQDEDDE